MLQPAIVHGAPPPPTATSYIRHTAHYSTMARPNKRKQSNRERAKEGEKKHKVRKAVYKRSIGGGLQEKSRMIEYSYRGYCSKVQALRLMSPGVKTF